MIRLSAIISIFSAFCLAQAPELAPVPPDPLELATGPTQVPATAQQRAAIVSLMDHAYENHFLHLRGTPAYTLQLSFTATATSLYPGGNGTLQQTWVSGENWRWSATLGNYSQVQLSSNAAVYNQNPAIMPLRMRTLRQAVFAPVPMNVARRSTIRTVDASWKGASVKCILLSAGRTVQVSAQGRQWYETEYCIDPASGLLQISSEAPGIYVAYDYANALKFHKRTLPGRITVTENGNTVLDAQLTSMTDADPNNLTLFTPTSQMVAQGAAPVMDAVERFPLISFNQQLPSSSVVQPVIIHATIDEYGKVREVEALQDSPAAPAALEAVIKGEFATRPQPSGASAHQREAFINVQSRPIPAGEPALLH